MSCHDARCQLSSCRAAIFDIRVFLRYDRASATPLLIVYAAADCLCCCHYFPHRLAVRCSGAAFAAARATEYAAARVMSSAASAILLA